MYIKISAIFLTLIAGAMLPACGKKTPEASAVEAMESIDSIPNSVKLLVKAVAEDDSVSFAGMVSYPLQRPYPLRDITNADEMKAYYKEIVDDSLRNVISNAEPSRWKEYGWRGWSLDDGRYIWVDENVYDVQYISHKEQKTIDSLTREEINSLPEGIREGWKPVMCLLKTPDGNVYRIDIRTKGKPHDGKHYRLAVYNPETNLRELPSLLLEGVMEKEGTAGTILYRFHDSEGSELTIEPDAPDSGTPVLIVQNDSTIELQRAYWHELIKSRQTESK